MAEDKRIQLEYGKKPPSRGPLRFVRSLLVLCSALALTVITLRTPLANGWIGYLMPVTCLVMIGALLVFRIWDFLHGTAGGEPAERENPGDSTYPHSYPAGGSLGIGANTFSGAQVGCAGAAFLVIFTVLCVFGLLAMVWWPYIHRLSNQ